MIWQSLLLANFGQRATYCCPMSYTIQQYNNYTNCHKQIKYKRIYLMRSFVCLFACLLHQITELSSELADERNTGESASQLLETETSERLRLERDMKDLQVETKTHTHTLVFLCRWGLQKMARLESYRWGHYFLDQIKL